MSGFSFASSAVPAPSTASGSTAATGTAAAVSPPAPVIPSSPQPNSTGFGASNPQAPPPPPPPPQDLLGRMIQEAISTGRLSNAGSAEIRSKLVAPFNPTVAAAPAAPPHLGGANPLAAFNSTNTLGSAQFSSSAAAPSFGVTAQPAGATATAPGLFSSIKSDQVVPSMQQSQGGGVSVGQQTAAAAAGGVDSPRSASTSQVCYLLDLLLLCESGSKIEGLFPAIGSIATAACSNIVAHISNSISAATAPKDSVGLGLGIALPSANSVGNVSQRSAEACLAMLSENGRYNSVLLASQCLFLLTRHFQINDECLKNMCSVLELLYTEVSVATPGGGNAGNMKARRGIRTRRTGGLNTGQGSTSYGIVDRRVASLAGSSSFASSSLFETFRRSATTSALSAITWLTTMSLVNTLCLWRDIHDANGKLSQNALLPISSVSSFLETWVTSQKKRLVPEVLKSDGYGNQMGGGGGGGSRFDVADFRSNRAAYGSADGDRNKARSQGEGSSIALGYVSIVTLCLAMFNSAKSEEINIDSALLAFFGQRPTQANAIPADKGKVAKRMMQLTPVAGSLIIPMECVYIVPYEMFSAIFDEMLPVVKCVADEDLTTYGTFSEESVEMEDRIARAQTTGRMQPTAAEHVPIAGPGLSHGMQGYDDRARDYSPHAAFSSEMAHILQLLTTCLEHLPPEVLNPDYDMDCSATFFIFKNCVVHLRAVFASQRPQSTWEPYTFKLVAHLLHVLAMIGRNPQYMSRVVSLLSTAQDECAELQWPALLAQAYECAGMNQGRGDLLFGGMYGSGSGGVVVDDGNRRAPLASLYASPAVGLPLEEEPYLDAVDFSHQHSKEYAMEKQQEYVASLFMLLRLVATHSSLFAEIREHITLDVALAFLFAPKLSQEMLGSSLALIGACIHTSADAEKVWRVLEDNQLLQYMEIPSHINPSSFTEEAFGRFFRSTGSTAEANLVTKNGDVVESLSLVGHCLYESHSAHYPITIGFLHLMIAIFRYHAPMVHCVPSYSTVVRFIAEDIMRGVLRRHFQTAEERYTVTALAAAALSKAFGVRFISNVQIGNNSGAAGTTGLMTPFSALPFSLVIATSKAPTDVLGEVLTIVDEAARSPNDLLNYKRAATYQCLQLIFEAIRAKKEQNIDNSFTFDARTVNSSSFAAQLLPLAAANDSLMAASALSLLYSIPADTVSGAAKSWFARPDVTERIINPFTSLLLPDTRSTSVVLAPPELSLLLEREHCDVHTPEFAVRTKSLLLDILVHHSTSPQSSLASWLFGYPMHGIAPTTRPSLCFTSIVSGATSKSIDAQHPDLAVKYVRILYQMRVNKTLNTTGLRDTLSMRHCQKLFTAALTLDPSSCSPAMLCKSGYVLKLLALEVFQLGVDEDQNYDAAGGKTAGSLMPASSANSAEYSRYALPQSQRQSISLRLVQLLIKLREHSRAQNVGFTDPHSNSTLYTSPLDDQVEEHTLLSMFQDASNYRSTNGEGSNGRQLIDFSRWILLCLESLTAFPSIHAPGGAELYVRRTLEDAPQYSIPMLHEGFQQERLESGKTPLTTTDMRNLLLPFVDANACLISYASAVQFVKGWCDLLETAVTLMPEASVNRLLTYVENISESMVKTSSLTLAAQEQIVCRLARSQRTLVARVHTCLRQAAEALLQNVGDAKDGAHWKATTEHSLVNPYWRSNGAERRYRAGESAALSGRRRSRSASSQSRIGGGGGASREYIYGRSYTPAHPSPSRSRNTGVYRDTAPYSTSVGRSLSVLNGDAEVSTVLRDGTKVPTVPFEESVLDQWLVEENCDRSRLSQILSTLLMNLLTLGPQVPAVRAELYEALLLFVSTPGVRIDELVLWRYYNELFALIVDDIVRPITSDTQVAALNLLRKLIISSAQMRDLFCVASGGAGGSTEVTAALAQSPATLGSSRAGSGGAASAHLLTFVSNTLYSIDNAAVTLFMNNSSPSAVTSFLEHVESVFDILSMLSIEYPWQVYRAQALSTCVGMKMWSLSARVALGHVAPHMEGNASPCADHMTQQQQQQQQRGDNWSGQSSGPQRFYPYNGGVAQRTDSAGFEAGVMNASVAPSASLPAETTDTSKEILKRLLMYAVRWYNTLLSQLQHSEDVENLLKGFLEQNDMLFKTVLSSPHSIARHGVVGQTTLTLLSEITGFLLTLSSTSTTAAACRSLISGLTLPELLSALVNRKFRDEVNRNVAVSHGSGSNGAGLMVRNGGRVDSGFGNAKSAMHLQQLISTIVRNLTLFLAHTESIDTMHGGALALGNGASSPKPLPSPAAASCSLRSNPQYVEVLITATSEVAEAIDSWLAQYRTEWKSGCSSYLLSLHALVFLLHSFALSTNSSQTTAAAAASQMTTATRLSKQELKDWIVTALSDAQEMLHHWFTPTLAEHTNGSYEQPQRNPQQQFLEGGRQPLLLTRSNAVGQPGGEGNTRVGIMKGRGTPNNGGVGGNNALVSTPPPVRGTSATRVAGMAPIDLPPSHRTAGHSEYAAAAGARGGEERWRMDGERASYDLIARVDAELNEVEREEEMGFHPMGRMTDPLDRNEITQDGSGNGGGGALDTIGTLMAKNNNGETTWKTNNGETNGDGGDDVIFPEYPDATSSFWDYVLGGIHADIEPLVKQVQVALSNAIRAASS